MYVRQWVPWFFFLSLQFSVTNLSFSSDSATLGQKSDSLTALVSLILNQAKQVDRAKDLQAGLFLTCNLSGVGIRIKIVLQKKSQKYFKVFLCYIMIKFKWITRITTLCWSAAANIRFNHGFEVFSICYSPRLMIISNGNHRKPVAECSYYTLYF